MQIYVVERHLVGWSATEVDDLVRRLDLLGDRLATAGARYLGSVILPTDEICLGLFEGPDADTVAQANQRLGLRVDRVLPARTSSIVAVAA